AGKGEALTATAGNAVVGANGTTGAVGDADFTNRDLALAILFNKDLLTVALGNKLFDTVIDLLDDNLSLGFDLKDLFYDELNANIQVKLDTSKAISLEVLVALGLVGGRYDKIATATEQGDSLEETRIIESIENVQDSTRYYVFRPETTNTESADYVAQKGYYVKGDDGTYIRVVKPDDVVNGTTYVKYRVLYGQEGDEETYKLYLRPMLDGNGNGDENMGTQKFAIKDGEEIYEFKPGASANTSFVPDGGMYDVDLSLKLSIIDLNVEFNNSRSYALSGEELQEYVNFGETDRIVLTETIDLTTSFKTGENNDIDLSEVISAFIPSLSSENLIKIISQADDGGDVNRKVQAVATLDLQMMALVNYARTHLSKYLSDDVVKEIFGDEDIFNREMTLFDTIALLRGLLENKDILGKHSSEILFDIVSFFDLKIFIQTKGGRDADYHDIFGIYFTGATFELLTSDEKDSTKENYVAPADRYDHYFENDKGAYQYVAATGSYTAIGDEKLPAGTKRYSFDPTYCYQNDLGGYKRVNGGIALDLSYFNMPSIYIDSSETSDIFGNIIGGLFGGNSGGSTSGDAATVSVANTAADDEDFFPLIKNDDLLGYIRTFVYGFSITSRYVQLLVQPNYINSILALFLDEDTVFKFDEEKFVNKPALTVYFDMSKHTYVNVQDLVNNIGNGEGQYTGKQVVDIMSASQYRFNITEYTGAGASKKGTYYKVDGENGAFELIAQMSASEKALYDQLVEEGKKSYYDIKNAEVYIRVDGEFVLYSTASKSQVKRAEKNDKAFDKYGIEIPTLFILTDSVPAGETSTNTYYVNVGDVTYIYTSLGAEKLYCVQTLEERHPFINLDLYLWNYKLSLGVNFPRFEIETYEYINVKELKDIIERPATVKALKDSIDEYELKVANGTVPTADETAQYEENKARYEIEKALSEAEKSTYEDNKILYDVISKYPNTARYRDTVKYLFSSEDKEIDGTYSWKLDYFENGAFSADKYEANPRWFASRKLTVDEETGNEVY
ncbi:MAG: hypothetical protein K2N18_05600, partial [Clostridia bacterium]|nr:hypothetical protein [Clostridia bacterium]